MGCSSANILNETQNEKFSKWKNIEFHIKDQLTENLKTNEIDSISIGSYQQKIYYKRKKWGNNFIKPTIRKIFIYRNKNKKSSSNENKFNQFLIDFFNKYFHYNKYNNTIINKETNKYFSPNKILNENFTEIIINLNVKKIAQNKLFCIYFYLDSIYSEKFTNYKNDNFYKYKITDEKDKYYVYNGYTIFFNSDNTILYWLLNESLDEEILNKLLNEEKKKFGLSDSKKIIKEFINENLEFDYKIYFQFYCIYDNKTSIISKKCVFPLIIKTNSDKKNKNNVYYGKLEEKINLIEIIKNNLKSLDENLNIKNIETFKEKKFSISNFYYFSYQKKFTIYLDQPINYDLINKIINNIKNYINLQLQLINKKYFIEHIVILPKENSQFLLSNKKEECAYVIIRYNKFIEYICQNFQYIYLPIYNNIKIICLYNNNNNVDKNIISNNSKNITFIEDDKINNMLLYFYNFNDANYFSHILLITDKNNNIQFSEFFRNSACSYLEYLTIEKFNIKKPLEFLNKKDLIKVKNDFIVKCSNNFNIKFIFQNNKKPANIFNECYDKNIFYQPYYSLKYNKVGENKYKNYVINLIDFEEPEFYDENPLNEISKYYPLNDEYFELTGYIRCKICNKLLYGKVTNSGIIYDNTFFIFYLCSMNKFTYCNDCYEKNENNFFSEYIYNLIYVRCKDYRIFSKISQNNINVFNKKDDTLTFPEVLDNNCDMCECKMNLNKEEYFYILLNVINKNTPYFVCQKCFNLIINDRRDWNLTFKYKYLNKFLYYNFIDLDNLLFRKVKINY